MIDQIKQILEDLFGIPVHCVDETDSLSEDWGIDKIEKAAFDAEFCAEFDISHVPEGTDMIEDYLSLVQS